MIGKSGKASSRARWEQRVFSDLVEMRHAEKAHGPVDLAAKDLQHVGDASLARDSEAPELRPPDETALRPESQRLHDIPAAPDAAVHQDRNAALDSLDDPG